MHCINCPFLNVILNLVCHYKYMIKTDNDMSIFTFDNIEQDYIEQQECTAFLLDHCYAGDCASLGIEYYPWSEDDATIEVVLPNDHEHYDVLADAALSSIAV